MGTYVLVYEHDFDINVLTDAVWKRGRKAIHTFLTPEAISEYLPLQKVESVQFLHDNLKKPNVRSAS